MPDTWWWLAALCALLGLVFVVTAFAALWRRRLVRMTLRLLLAIVFIALSLAFGATGLGIQGYRALTREEVAVTVQTQPLGAKRFRAQFRFPDGRETTYVLAGDELYVDARILKWRPWVNILGLHTTYQLDRVSGRYADLVQEQQQPRTVFSVIPERPVDLFSLRQRYAALGSLLDAEYGSATFAAVDVPAQYEVRVSTTGLLIRRIEPAS